MNRGTCDRDSKGSSAVTQRPGRLGVRKEKGRRKGGGGKVWSGRQQKDSVSGEKVRGEEKQKKEKIKNDQKKKKKKPAMTE